MPLHHDFANSIGFRIECGTRHNSYIAGLVRSAIESKHRSVLPYTWIGYPATDLVHGWNQVVKSFKANTSASGEYLHRLQCVGRRAKFRMVIIWGASLLNQEACLLRCPTLSLRGTNMWRRSLLFRPSPTDAWKIRCHVSSMCLPCVYHVSAMWFQTS